MALLCAVSEELAWHHEMGADQAEPPSFAMSQKTGNSWVSFGTLPGYQSFVSHPQAFLWLPCPLSGTGQSLPQAEGVHPLPCHPALL